MKLLKVAYLLRDLLRFLGKMSMLILFTHLISNTDLTRLIIHHELVFIQQAVQAIEQTNIQVR